METTAEELQHEADACARLLMRLHHARARPEDLRALQRFYQERCAQAAAALTPQPDGWATEA
ncbi:MAG TPA: hypothetical protein VK545_22160, partial [Streptomyces sp.]|nr:hypothetical protein [Streptomyces sp.]